MSITWMVLIAALIALEKTLPWRRAVTWGTAAILLALAIAVSLIGGALPSRRAVRLQPLDALRYE